MMVLVSAIEGFVASHGLEFTNEVSTTWRYSARAARGVEARASVLCFGDSLVKMGLQPRVIEASRGGRVHNLAVFCGQAPSSFFLLRRALESGARPRAVVVDFHSNLLATVPKENRQYWSDLVDARDTLDLVWSTRDPRFALAIIGDRLFPSIKGRNELGGGILAALHGVPFTALERRRDLLRTWRLNDGAQVTPPREPAIDPLELRVSARWSPLPVHAAYVRRFLDLAEAHGIDVYWLVPPLSPILQSRRDRVDVEQAFTGFAAAMQAGRKNLVIVDARRVGYPASAFIDATHLNNQGGAQLSRALAGVMALHSTATPRWVELTPALAERYSRSLPVRR
jgi:hypothetical protein